MPVVEGATPRDALHRRRELVQHAERLGYHRYWVAEHHNMPGIASAATAVVLGYLGEATATIRLRESPVRSWRSRPPTARCRLSPLSRMP